jgi:predicted DNA-binding protein
MATATKQSTTVRISEQAHHRLRELAAQSGEPMQAVLDKALEQYRRQKFLEECNAAYAVLQQDPQAWADYQEELAVWDVTLTDGLDPEEGGKEGGIAHAGDPHG